MNIHQQNCFEPGICPLYMFCKMNRKIVVLSALEFSLGNKLLPKDCTLHEGPVHISLATKPFIEQEPII